MAKTTNKILIQAFRVNLFPNNIPGIVLGFQVWNETAPVWTEIYIPVYQGSESYVLNVLLSSQ